MNETPSGKKVREERIRRGYTQTYSADLIDRTCRWWQMVEAGTVKMPATLWELWLLKAK